MIPLRPIIKNRRGNVSLETALLLPLILLVVLGGLEVALALMTDAAVELGIRTASRYGLSSSAVSATERAEKIESTVKAFVARWTKNTEATVTVTRTAFSSFEAMAEPFTDKNDNGQWDYGEPFDDVNGNGVYDVWNGSGGSDDSGTSGAIVLYTVEVHRKPFTNLLNLLSIDTGTGSWNWTFYRHIAVMNE